MAENKLPVTTSMQMAKIYFVLLVLNSLVLVLGNFIFPEQIVLGTMNLSFWWSVFHSMSVLSLIGMLSVPLFEWKQEKLNRELTPKEWMVGYLVINFVGLWIISRFSEQFGLGFSAWWVVLLIASVMDVVQGIGMMMVYKKQN